MSNPVEELQRIYGAASLVSIAAANGVKGGDPAEKLAAAWAEPSARAALVQSLPDDQRGMLAFVDAIGRRLRGERLKKRWFLHGYNDFDDLIQPLVDRGIVLVGNIAAREALSLETALEQGLTQHWVQVTPGFEGLAGDPPEQREVVEQLDDETTVEFSTRAIILEFNVLVATGWLEHNRVRLNRDGSPHRSDLKGLAPFIVDRGAAADAVPDPNDLHGWNLLVFLLSVAAALGLIERQGGRLRVTGTGRDYFRRSASERMPLLLRAIEQQRAWSELDAMRWHAAGEPPQTGQGDGGFLEEGGHGATLAGPRGSVLSALRRLAPVDWFDLDETARTIALLEKQYLANSLPIATGDETSLHAFVGGILSLTLPSIGAADLGRSPSGQRRVRLTPLGRAMLGLPDPKSATGQSDVIEDPSGERSILVEPTFEITCFLDLASLPLLHDLSRFASLVRVSERVVRFRLTGESVQWGYSRGYDAEGIAALLGRFGAQPVPANVISELQNWERLHRRVTVMLCGDLVAAAGRSDPEVVQSGVLFAIDDPDEREAIDVVHTFIIAGNEEKLDRALRANRPRVIDYAGPIVPTVSWLDDARIRAPGGESDLRTVSRLQRFCVAEDDETWRIDPDQIRDRFPDGDGYDSLIAVLREGLVGGLTAEREIGLKGLLGEPAEASMQQMDVLLLASADDGDRVARIAALQPFIAQRLGPRAFHVVPGTVTRLTEHLRVLGIAVGRSPGR
jgi:hypothetical protein